MNTNPCDALCKQLGSFNNQGNDGNTALMDNPAVALREISEL